MTKQYAYLLTPKEFDKVDKSEFLKIYPPSHPLGRRCSTKNHPMFLGLMTEHRKDIPGCIGEWAGFDNPIIHEPSTNAEYLTHYILSTKDDSIVGKVVFDRKVQGGEYIATMNDGTERFRTCGQTSFLTHEEMQEREESLSAKDADIYLWFLQMMYLP